VCAEDSAAHAEQQAAWEGETAGARAELERLREALGVLEPRHAAIAAELTDAEQALKRRLEAARAVRTAALVPDRDALAVELTAVEGELAALKSAPKEEKKAAARKVHDAREKLNRANRALDGITSWTPPPDQLVDERAAVERSRNARESLRTEEDAPARRSSLLRSRRTPSSLPAATAQRPAVPRVSATLHLGRGAARFRRLYESDGARFLAVKTWSRCRARCRWRSDSPLLVSTGRKQVASSREDDHAEAARGTARDPPTPLLLHRRLLELDGG
jgi:hypothetical protein